MCSNMADLWFLNDNGCFPNGVPTSVFKLKVEI